DQELSEQDIFLIQDQPEKLQEVLQACLDALPGDPRFYTTSVAIKDFESVRETLEVPKWNLFGVSYGTRVAIHYMRRHADSIRTAVLDSVVPPDHILGADIALLSQKILDHLYQRCEQDAECNEQFPNLKREVEMLFARLD